MIVARGRRASCSNAARAKKKLRLRIELKSPAKRDRFLECRRITVLYESKMGLFGWLLKGGGRGRGGSRGWEKVGWGWWREAKGEVARHGGVVGVVSSVCVEGNGGVKPGSQVGGRRVESGAGSLLRC